MALLEWNPNYLGGSGSYVAARSRQDDDQPPSGSQTLIDPATGKLYESEWQAGPRGDDWVEGWSQPKETGKLFSNDPTELKMLQAGYQPMGGGVWSTKADFGPGNQYVMAPSAMGSGPGAMFSRYAISRDPTTGAVVLNPNIDVGAILTDYRNSIYTGGDFFTRTMDSLGPLAPFIPLLPVVAGGGIGAIGAAETAAPVAGALSTAAPSAIAPEIAAELNALQASTTGLGSGMGSSSIVDQLISNLPSVQSMAQKAAINAATQLVTTGEVNPEKVLASTLTGALGSTVGSTVAQDVLSATNSSLAASIASGAAQGATVAAITGNDPIQTALASAAASGLGSVAKDSGIAVPQSVINSVVSSVASGAPLGQVLTGAAISAGTGLAKDAVSNAMTAYNADQQTSGLQAASDLGNAPTQGFDNNGNPIYRDSSGVWTNSQGVPVDPFTGEAITTAADEYTAPTFVAGTADTAEAGLPYKTDYTGSYVSSTGEVPPVIGDYPVQTMPEIVVEAQQPADVGLPSTTMPSPSPLSTATGTNAPVTATVPVSAASTPSATSGTSGTAAAAKKDSDYSTYIPPIPGYLRDTMLTTGKPSEGSALWQGIDPRLASILTQRAAHGGAIHPQLMKVLQERGGELVPGPENRMYMRHAKRGFAVTGPGTGQSDDIPTMLADSEYVIDADTVAALGDGSSKAGAEVLDKMRMAIRKHKRSAPIDKIPPKAKSPLEYIKEGMKMNIKKK